MTSFPIATAAFLLALAQPATAAQPPTAPPPPASNAEMAAIFQADQADRAPGPAIDWAVVGPRDEARQARTRALLDTGKLRTGDDFYFAAFVFQHGRTAEDYLMAHALAVAATARGRDGAA